MTGRLKLAMVKDYGFGVTDTESEKWAELLHASTEGGFDDKFTLVVKEVHKAAKAIYVLSDPKSKEVKCEIMIYEDGSVILHSEYGITAANMAQVMSEYAIGGLNTLVGLHEEESCQLDS